MKAKASVDNSGLKIPADWSVIVTIEDFQKRTGITIDGKRLDWVHHCRLKVRGAFCSISHAHITGPGGIWLTLFASREQE